MLVRVLAACFVAFALFAQQPRTTARARSAKPAAKTTTKAPAKTTLPPVTPDTTAQTLLDSMSLRDRVAQLVMGVAYGDVYSTKSDDYKKYYHWISDLILAV